jgi:hypothetical protein
LRDELPLNAQVKVLDQASDMIGLAPIPGARSQIVGPLLRHAKI